ncbi:MAG TPA: hypothetical protein VN914_21500 [Polyangia bacterium]|nr:hypothetical protein [Polyangia bacterium]
MERLLARLERKYGRYAPGNLTYGLIAAQVAGLALGLGAPGLRALLYFEWERILHGEIWRVVTWLAIPPFIQPGPLAWWDLLMTLIGWSFLYWIGGSLERDWGSLKFFVFWLLGVLGTIVAAAISGAPTDNKLFLLTFFLAFATLWPDVQIRLYFLFPIKVKWLALISAIYLVHLTLTAHGFDKLLPVMMVGNYLLFFHQALYQIVRGWIRQAERAGVRNRTRAERAALSLPSVRTCAICGASNRDPEVEIRVCDCAKCGGVRRDLCLPHARSH